MYIRTKYGVYEVEQSQLEDDEEVVNCDYGQIHKLEILRKSENLEEVIDGYYIDDGKQEICINDMYTHINTFKNDMRYYKNCCVGNYIGYGFIKTNKGLIYVAKMDNDGKLVLI